jgi:hypothetical protein
LPDVVGKICRYNGGIQERDLSIVLILRLPIASKQPQANRSPQDAPIRQPRAAYRIANTLGEIAGYPVTKRIVHCAERRMGRKEQMIATFPIPYGLGLRSCRNEVA